MEKVYNDKLKELYINKFKLNDIFTDEMSGYMELVLFRKGEYICNEREYKLKEIYNYCPNCGQAIDGGQLL